ncbi:TetR/AcrR family transcriptional regulator [[Eubacterium] cellulosolvens]
MIKIIMEHDERVKDIIDKAEELFAKKGYDKTSIADIIKKVGIAKGTFYHYFKSKDELLDAIVDRMLREIWDRVDVIVAKDDLDAIGKVFGLFGVFRTIAKGREQLMEDLHKEENAHIHLKIEKKMYPEITPKFEKIISQGVAEGVFDTKYPGEAARVIMASIAALTELKEHVHNAVTREVDMDRVKMFLDLIERILGAKPGTFMKYVKKMGGFNEKK